MWESLVVGLDERLDGVEPRSGTPPIVGLVETYPAEEVLCALGVRLLVLHDTATNDALDGPEAAGLGVSNHPATIFISHRLREWKHARDMDRVVDATSSKIS